MNYKIARTMLTLCIVYLIGFYILKFIFPDLLIQTITDPTVLKFGDLLQKWVGFVHLFNVIGTIVTFYLFACASTGRFKFTRVEIAIILGGVSVSLLVYYLLPELYTHSSAALMLIVAWLCKGKLRNTVITFTIHGYLSQLLLSIRGFDTVITTVPQAALLGGIILASEMYVWLILLAIIFNIKEGKGNGSIVSAISEQNGRGEEKGVRSRREKGQRP